MKNKKTLKYNETHQKIMDAYQKLVCKKKHFQTITVKEISEAAQINRKSFYLHFENVEALQRHCQELMIYRILEKLIKEPDLAAAIREGKLTQYKNELLKENYTFYIRIISETSFTNLYQGIRHLIINNYGTKLPCLPGYTSEETLQTLTFLIFTGLSIYRFNYQNNLGYTPEQLEHFIARNGKLLFRLQPH